MPTKRLSPFQPSTIALFKEGRRTPGYSLLDFLHGYVYGRWPYLYIGIGTGEHPLSTVFARLSGLLARLFLPRHASERAEARTTAQAFADTYHGKVVPLEAAKQLLIVRENVRLENLEKIIPYRRARDIILTNPDHITVLDCPCRSARPEPCLPLDVCLIVGEPFAGFVAEHHPRRSRRITSHEALEILQAEQARGHVHHAFFKDALLGRFYAICNCCACCCGALQAHRRGTPMLVSSGYLCTVDTDRCLGCGDCNNFCQFFALSLADGHARVEQALCMGCGVCVSACEQGALALERAPDKGEPLEIIDLIEQQHSPSL